MLLYALGFLAAAALVGLMLASFVLRDRFPPWALSLLHLALGATGIGFVGYAVLSQGAEGGAAIALVILVLAAVGGLTVASFHLRRKGAPRALILGHAGAAITGVAILAATVFGIL